MEVTEVRGEHLLFDIRRLLTPKECAQCIALADDPATIRHPLDHDWKDARPDNGASYLRARRYLRDMADELFLRIAPILPEEYEGYRDFYLNPCFRFSKYHEGGRFAVHHDGQNYDSSRPEEHDGHDAITVFTLNINLNTGFEGGETDFFHGSLKARWNKKREELRHRHQIVPEVGRASLFYFDQPHRGNIVRRTPPCKILMRTDVMGHC